MNSNEMDDEDERLAAAIDNLGNLQTLRHGWGVYFSGLLGTDDLVLKFAAAYSLLEMDVTSPEIDSSILKLCGYLPIRRSAFEKFSNSFGYVQLRELLDVPPASLGSAQFDVMRATFELDFMALGIAEQQRYLETADPKHLVQAHDAFEFGGGWKVALPHAVNLVLINPRDPSCAFRLYNHLVNSNQLALLARMKHHLQTAELFPVVVAMSSAQLLKSDGRSNDALKVMDSINVANLPPFLEREIASLKATLHEAAGNYRAAYSNFVLQNELGRSKNFDPKRLAVSVLQLASLPVFTLPHDQRTNHFIMLGFPRSGTTLLENIFQSHPEIETLEEMSGFQSMNLLVNSTAANKQAWTAETALQARDRYYSVLDHFRTKYTARIVVDKLPILTARAKFLKGIFPDKGYIFSIRHPFDVVLSCFKQSFRPNMAMDSFTTFEDCCAIYNFTMDQWFSTFGNDNPKVCYVRYDDLVLQPKEALLPPLEFVGAQWREEILEFATKAEHRPVKTPSYQMVRKGLTLGVQSSWKKYQFLFESSAAELLHRWVDKFGYDRVLVRQ